ncbi:MAG TPA: HD domain-containing protein [Geobacteraceae bacterium]
MNAVALLGKYFPGEDAFSIVLDHGRRVAAKALRVAENLESAKLDLGFLEEAALLHDIGVCGTNAPKFHCHGVEPYIRHGIIGRDILDGEGLPRHALVCERHIGVGLTADDVISQGLPLPLKEMAPLSLEEKIVCFADLFHSKNPEKCGREKTIAEIRKGLLKFGDNKVLIFNKWLKELKYE